MLREIELSRHVLYAKACTIRRETVISVIAVDIRCSTSLSLISDDFGIAVNNELGNGFVISWSDIKALQNKLNISDEKYEYFIENLKDDFFDTVIKMLKEEG